MITLTFTPEQLQILDKAIAELPFRVAAPLVQEINKQIQASFDKSVDARDSQDK